MLTRKNVGNTSEKCWQHFRTMLTKKMLVTLPKNVDEKKYWQTSKKMLRKNVGKTSEKC
jgi:hypothetical protein